MRSIRKNDGFTLVELVVAVAVLGIITVIALPTVNNIQKTNRVKKYESYEKSILSSAKLYVDSYEDDKFDKNSLEAQCRAITYDDLKNHNLLKVYKVNNVTCGGQKIGSDSNVAAYVYRGTDGKYKYYPMISCTKNNVVEYESNTDLKIPSICEMSSNHVSFVSDDRCFSSKDPQVTLNVNAEKIKESDQTIEQIDYAIIESTDKNSTDKIKKANYTNNVLYKSENETTNKVINILTPNDNLKKRYRLVLRYKYNNTDDYKYEVLKQELTVDYTKPELTIVARKWNNNNTSVTYDNYKESATSQYKSNNWTNKNVYLSATATDGCGKKVNVKIDGNDVNYTNVTEETSGSGKKVKFEVEYGKNSIATQSVTVNIDKTAPTVSILATDEKNTVQYADKIYTGTDSNNDDGFNILDISNTNTDNIKWYKDRVYYNISIEDSLSGTNSTEWRWNNTNILPTATVTDKKASAEKNVSIIDRKNTKEQFTHRFSLGSNGYRQGWYTVKDQAGNTTKIKIVAIQDNQSPKAPTTTVKLGSTTSTKQINYNPDGTKWTNQDMEWTDFKAEETNPVSPVSYEYRKKGDNNWLPLKKSSYKYTANNVNYSLYIRAKDEAGNVSKESGPFNFRIDKVAPNAIILDTENSNKLSYFEQGYCKSTDPKKNVTCCGIKTADGNLKYTGGTDASSGIASEYIKWYAYAGSPTIKAETKKWADRDEYMKKTGALTFTRKSSEDVIIYQRRLLDKAGNKSPIFTLYIYAKGSGYSNSSGNRKQCN